MDCGKKYPSYVMDLDHVSGTKIREISKMIYYASKRFLEEMGKVQPVCANCHRVRTFERNKIGGDMSGRLANRPDNKVDKPYGR